MEALAVPRWGSVRALLAFHGGVHYSFHYLILKQESPSQVAQIYQWAKVAQVSLCLKNPTNFLIKFTQ